MLTEQYDCSYMTYEKCQPVVMPRPAVPCISGICIRMRGLAKKSDEEAELSEESREKRELCVPREKWIKKTCTREVPSTEQHTCMKNVYHKQCVDVPHVIEKTCMRPVEVQLPEDCLQGWLQTGPFHCAGDVLPQHRCPGAILLPTTGDPEAKLHLILCRDGDLLCWREDHGDILVPPYYHAAYLLDQVLRKTRDLLQRWGEARSLRLPRDNHKAGVPISTSCGTGNLLRWRKNRWTVLVPDQEATGGLRAGELLHPRNVLLGVHDFGTLQMLRALNPSGVLRHKNHWVLLNRAFCPTGGDGWVAHSAMRFTAAFHAR